jgi:hypothetical protein
MHDEFGSIMQKADTSLDSTVENVLDDSVLDDDAFLDLYGHTMPTELLF